jgi:cytidylate kinase
MGFKVWDKELLSAIAEEGGADELFLASLDERRRKLVDDALHGSLLGAKQSNTHYYRSLLSVVQTIGAHGKSIIVGRGSNYIIKSPEPFRVRIVCPLDKRVKFVAKNDKVSEKEAQNIIKERDADRVDFVRHYFKADPSNAHDYDLVINSGVFNLEDMSDLIVSAYEKKVGKTVPHPN